MTVYYIVDNITDKVIAISEFKRDVCQFFIQNNYDYKNYSIYNTTKNKKCNDLLRDYYDLYLLGYNDYIIRNKDYQVLTDIIDESRYKMKRAIKDLSYIMDMSNLTKKEKKAFKKVIKTLDENKKKRMVENFLNINEFIEDYYNIPSLQEQLTRLNDDFEFYILKED